MILSKQEIQSIISNANIMGANPNKVLDRFVNDGWDLEGVDMESA